MHTYECSIRISRTIIFCSKAKITMTSQKLRAKNRRTKSRPATTQISSRENCLCVPGAAINKDKYQIKLTRPTKSTVSCILILFTSFVSHSHKNEILARMKIESYIFRRRGEGWKDALAICTCESAGRTKARSVI